MSILDHYTRSTPRADKTDARGRVLQALRGAGSKGLRRDALEDASSCRSVVQRVQELRQLGHQIESHTDSATDFSIYVLVKEATYENQVTTQSQIRITLSKPRDSESVARLQAMLTKAVAEWEEGEDKPRKEVEETDWDGLIS